MVAGVLALMLLAPPPYLAKERFLADARALLPRHQEIPKMAAFAAGVFVLTRTDRKPSSWFADHAPSELGRFEPLGRYQVGNVLGLGLFAWGVGASNPRLASAGVAFVEANLFSSLAVSGIQKLAGRQRPGYPHAGQFGRGGTSFPSAHAAHAFAAAGVAYTAFPEFRFRWSFPLLASAVALSRVSDRKHFFADVAFSAGLGWWVGHRLGDSALGLGRVRWGLGPRGAVLAVSLP
ncbi:MAG: phosphatase PAP2 family protein [Thermoanaerobaculum sp.]